VPERSTNSNKVHTSFSAGQHSGWTPAQPYEGVCVASIDGWLAAQASRNAPA
jgi:hypothetical protein